MRPVVAGLVCAAALLTAPVACSSAPRDPAERGPTAAPTSAPVVPTAPASVVPRQDWSSGAVRVDNPDGLAAVDRAVFVKTDDGRVVRIDPDTRRVVAETRIDTAHDRATYCQGIGSDGRSLWACSAGDRSTDLVRLDPDSLDVTRRVAVDKVFDQYALPVVGGRVWVLTGDGDTLAGVDARTGRVATTSIPVRCFQLAATSRVVYATCLLDDEVIAVDARTGDLLGTAEVVRPTNVATLGGDVWVSGAEGLLHLDADLTPVASYPGLTAGAEGDLLATGSALWVRSAERFLVRIDPTSGRVAARYAIRPPPSGGSLLFASGSLWTSASDDGLVYRVDPRPR